MDRPFNAAPLSFWLSFLAVHLMSWIWLGLASWITPQSWQDKPAGTTRISWRQRWRNWLDGKLIYRTALRARQLDINPLLWLGLRGRMTEATLWAFFAVACFAWTWLSLKMGDELMEPYVCVFVMVILHSVLKVWVASEASGRFSEDKRSGALELLISTPLSVKEILRGHILALRCQFFWPVVFILFCDVLLLSTALRLHGNEDDFLVVSMLIMVMFVCDLFALAWTGLWVSLKSKVANRASGSVVFRVLVIPWLVHFFFLFSAGSMGGIAGFVGTWFFIGLMTDFFFYFSSKGQLEDQFRVLIADPVRKPAENDFNANYSLLKN